MPSAVFKGSCHKVQLLLRNQKKKTALQRAKHPMLTARDALAEDLDPGIALAPNHSVLSTLLPFFQLSQDET